MEIDGTNERNANFTWPPLVQPRSRADLQTSLESLRLAAERQPYTPVERTAAQIVLASGHYALGDFDQCLETLNTVRFDNEDADLEVHDLVLRLIGQVLQGLRSGLSTLQKY